MSTANNKPFLFPHANSTVLPDPSKFFSSNLLSTPLPTNSFFQNFVLKNGDQPEYIHPYLIKSSNSSLSISYPNHSSNSKVIFQVFKPDITITSSKKDSQKGSNGKHVISSYSDLSVTLDIPCINTSFFLVRGSPYVTLSFTIRFNNNQAWILYTSIKIKLTHSRSEITSEAFSGNIRIALLPDSDSKHEAVLDRCSFCYPVSGDAILREPFCVEYKWEKKGWGDLLMLAHPLHLQLLSENDLNNVTVLNDFKYKSIDGDLVGVVGDSWILKTDPVSVTWYSKNGVKEKHHEEIVSSLFKDVEGLNSSSIETTSCHVFGKLIARAARLALIAEEVFFYDVIPKVKVKKFLKETIEPWLEGTFKGNGFLYDKKWGGIVTKQGCNDVNAEYGFGIYNNHHYSLGFFVYAIAVLVKIDPAWGRKYKAQAYALLEDFMNLSTSLNSNYSRLRCFDLYNLHSWAGGLTEFADGRNQMGSSEAVFAYYAAALFGMAYGDAQVVSIGSTLAALEICATKMWWHVKKDGNIYEKGFTKENRIIGVLWSNKRDSGLWFAPAECREARIGIQVLPLCPISEVLFSDVEYVKELVEWALPALKREGVDEGWKGYVFALQGIFDKKVAMKNIKTLKGFEDSMTNLLWWLHSRG
ncbi:glucan endo-1,3-beta-D-glucosidase ARB_01444-like [Vicia villosa]|uniref:glucan endo-1,3-beta-D-glucosidase ARB_01444-like n=1 Tax=Vicia villosa TaxID=3911 RepID=UPI00273B742A|nr:glucan endo-1,3-beta-D-glucosidase ARB_01444-like [Vicia villosa]